MDVFELTLGEQEVLLQVLERCHYNLRVEIVNTDNREFRRELKQREAVIKDLMDRLKKKMA